jgi:cbb3-type cytochrome oxidase subunit 3
MHYDYVAYLSQVSSLLIFVSLFIAILGYAFWPGNIRKFERAQRRALDLGAADKNGEGER